MVSVRLTSSSWVSMDEMESEPKLAQKISAAVRLQRKLHRCAAHLQHRQKMVGQQRRILLRCPGICGQRKTHHHDLVSAGAGDERLRRVGQDRDVRCARAAGEDRTQVWDGRGVRLRLGGRPGKAVAGGGLRRFRREDRDAAAHRLVTTRVRMSVEMRASPGCSPVPATAISRRALRSMTLTELEPLLAT